MMKIMSVTLISLYSTSQSHLSTPKVALMGIIGIGRNAIALNVSKSVTHVKAHLQLATPVL